MPIVDKQYMLHQPNPSKPVWIVLQQVLDAKQRVWYKVRVVV